MKIIVDAQPTSSVQMYFIEDDQIIEHKTVWANELILAIADRELDEDIEQITFIGPRDFVKHLVDKTREKFPNTIVDWKVKND